MTAPTGWGYSDVHLYRNLFWQARRYWPHFGAHFLLSLLATPIALLTPLPLKIVIDSVLGSRPLPEVLDDVLPSFANSSEERLLIMLAVLMVVVALIDQLQKVSTSVFGSYIGEKVTLAFRARLFRHVQRLSLSFHDMRGTADSVYRIQYDATSIQQVSVYGVTPFVTAGFTVVSMILVMVAIDWQLAVVALAVVPIATLLTLEARRRLRDSWRRAKRLESAAQSVLQEVLTGLRVVKAFAQEEREEERFVARSGAGMRSRIRIAFVDGMFGVLVGLTTAAGTALVLYLGARQVRSGALTLGDLVLVMAYLAQLYVPMQYISKSVTGLQSALASAERAFALLEEPHEVAERKDAKPLHRARGAVSLRDVSFSYGDGEPVLSDISFDLPPGARLGIAGTTGAGKSTLVSLLTRFYDPTAGAILLDGVDLREYRLADLRNQFGIVLQDTILFSTTVAENIAYARPDARLEDVVEAAKAASIHDLISSLPEGYETIVGERGMRLSGGERQRVAIARAYLKDAPILILDEPTSSVDTKTEATIIEAMERLMEDRTTIMIAHRQSTLKTCDVRLQIEAGRIASIGAAEKEFRRQGGLLSSHSSGSWRG